MTLYGTPPDPDADINPDSPAIPHHRAASDEGPIEPYAGAAGDTGRGPAIQAEPSHPASVGVASVASGSVNLTGTSSAETAARDSTTEGMAAADTAGTGTAGTGTTATGTEATGTIQTTTAAVGTASAPRAATGARVEDATAYALSDLEPPDEAPEIPPWDRRPLMVVLAIAAVLVMLAIASGMASANLFRGQSPAWQAAAGATDGPSPTTAPVVPPPAQQTVTLSGVGDIIMGSLPGSVPPNDGAGFFDEVKSALAADLVMGNLDMPLTEDTGRVKCAEGSTGCHQFYLPPSYAGHLRDGGFHLVSLANNHTNDMGADGLRNTRAALEAAGVQHTGAPNQITTVDVKGFKIAVLGFSVYAWGQNLNNIPAAEELVRKADAEADIVVIQMQGGAEGSDKAHVRPGPEIFLGENRGDLIKFSHAVIDAGADVVMGHGPHIMRGMEFYKGRLIAYSLGNFCGYKVLNSSGYLGVGGVLKVTLTKDGSWAGGELVSTEMVRSGFPAPDPDMRALEFVNGLSQEDFGDAAAQISTTDGAITPPETP